MLLNEEVGARAVERLEAVRRRLFAGWSRGALARDSAGVPCDVFSREAVSWCLAGALRRSGTCVTALDERAYILARQRILIAAGLVASSGLGSLAALNDAAGHVEDVVKYVDAAIAMLSELESPAKGGES